MSVTAWIAVAALAVTVTALIDALRICFELTAGEEA